MKFRASLTLPHSSKLLGAVPFWGPLDDGAVIEEVDFKNFSRLKFDIN